MKQFIFRSYRGLKRRIRLLRRPVDKPAKKIHKDLLKALLPPQRTSRVERDYWEKRGANDQNNEDVVWVDSAFNAVEATHISYLWSLSRDKDVLDVGAGWGRIGMKLQGSYRSYTGLEQSASMIARSRLNNLTLIQGSGVRMPFPEGSFDVIFMVMCISSVYHQVFKIYDESMRCLRTNGILVILEPSVTVVFEKPR